VEGVVEVLTGGVYVLLTGAGVVYVLVVTGGT